ncbi:VanW family protein [Paenibacillus hodogayensis]|uniref:VanW family protein n=1 Tax=Paenibacillus hodogayensis TaxID=279208 RepID=A0ABV5W7D3_9BACL
MSRQLANRFLLAAVAAIALLWGWFWWYSGLRTVPAGVRLGGWSIGGLTQRELELGWQSRLERLRAEKVRLVPDGKEEAARTFTLTELGLIADENRLAELTDYVFGGSRLDKAKRRWAMRKAYLPFEAGLSAQAMNGVLTAAWPQGMKPNTINAKRIVTADDRIDYTPEQGATVIDTAKLAERLTALAREHFDSFATVESAGNGANPESATVMPLPKREVPPEVTVEQLKAQGVSRKISEFSTSFPGGAPGRVHNIQATAGTIHDKLLAPGERFDYSTVIRETELRSGYQEAPVIFNGKLVPGIGGGICQVSTTLYNAALRAGLQIDERRNHSLPVSYVPLGQDATFASGYINFQFTNNTGAYLLIHTESGADRITVKLFGTMPESAVYEIESHIVQTLEPPVKYVRNPTLAPGAQSVLQKGKPGYVVETFRTRKEGGVVVNKERVSKDTYQPQPTLIAIRGSDAPSPDGKEPHQGGGTVIEDGVSGPVFPRGR